MTPTEFDALLEEARASLKPGFEPGRAAQLMSRPLVYDYRDVLLFLAGDVEQQLAAKRRDLTRLTRSKMSQADMLELENLNRWRDKAEGFKRHVNHRLSIVENVIRHLDPDGSSSLKARVAELEKAIRDHKHACANEDHGPMDLRLWSVLS